MGPRDVDPLFLEKKKKKETSFFQFFFQELVTIINRVSKSIPHVGTLKKILINLTEELTL